MTERPNWLGLFRSLRPGSKTILFRPPSVDLVVEFARRGFRLLVVHSNEELLSRCKAELRAQGLSSLLMGVYTQTDSKDLSTAKEFYEICCCFESVEDVFQTLRASLRPRGLLVGPPGAFGKLGTSLDGFHDCSEPLSNDLLGFRLA